MATTTNTTTLLTQNIDHPHNTELLPQQTCDINYNHDYEADDDDSMMEEEDADTRMTSAFSLGVTFSLRDQVLEIPSREEYTPEEIQAAHYSKEDYKGMKHEASETIKLHFAGKLSGDDHCMRGLECRTNAGFSFVKNNRQQASFAVIDEQDRQDEVGISDPYLISEAYQKSSLSCRCYAFAQGLFDAQEVIKDILASGTLPSFHNGDGQALLLDQDMLLRVLSNTTAHANLESGCRLCVEKDVDAPPLDSMEWTAEAA